MALKWPKVISTSFLLHSIPLHGMQAFDGMPVDIENINEVKKVVEAMVPSNMTSDDVVALFQSVATNPEGFPPKNHELIGYWAKSATKMP